LKFPLYLLCCPWRSYCSCN